MFTSPYGYATNALKQPITIIKQYFILKIHGPKNFLYISFIQSLLIKFMYIWMQGFVVMFPITIVEGVS